MGRRKRIEDLEIVRRDIEEWRGSQEKGRRMPEELWSRAAGLAQKHGVGAVSKELSLHYTKLRDRTRPCGEAILSPTFVKLEPEKGLGDVTAANAVVNVTRSDGSAMSLHLQLRPEDAGVLVEGFFRQAG